MTRSFCKTLSTRNLQPTTILFSHYFHSHFVTDHRLDIKRCLTKNILALQ